MEDLPNKLLVHSNGAELAIKILNLEQPLYMKNLKTKMAPFVYFEEDSSRMNLFTHEK